MSDETTANKHPAEPQLCVNGCGFFGNGAHGGFCSKCFREMQKQQGLNGSIDSSNKSHSIIGVEEKSSHAEVHGATEQNPSEDLPNVEVPKKKKKKKTSYKSMLAGVLQNSTVPKDVEKEKNDLSKVTGGGSFLKVDKI